MSADTPAIYLLYGEDDYQVAQKLVELSARLGDSTTASMNTARLDGAGLTIEQLRAAAGAVPFLASYRLVIVDGLHANCNKSKDRDKFIDFLERLPPTAIMVLVENRWIKDEENWLLHWCVKASPRAQVINCWPPKGGAMIKWIDQRVHDYGSQITPAAAKELAGLMGDDTRSADQEIRKLLAYVNFQRKIEVEDVKDVCISVEEIWVNQLVEAVLKQEHKNAVKLLEQLLETADPIYLLVAFTNQIRRLILLGDMLSIGMRDAEIFKELTALEKSGFGKKAFEAVKFQYKYAKPGVLERIFHRLLDVDESIKTGQVPGDLALEMLVEEFTTQKP